MRLRMRLIDLIKANWHKIGPESMIWSPLSRNANITLEDMLETPDFPWDMNYACYNPNVTMKHRSQHPELNLIWRKIVYNKSITIQDVVRNKNKPWSWYTLTSRFPLKCIYNYPMLPWDYAGLSSNYDTTIQHVLLNDDISWDWECLSSHINITPRDVCRHPELPWISYALCENPNFSIYDLIHFRKTYRPDEYPYFVNIHTNCIFRDILDIGLDAYEWNWNMLSTYIQITCEDLVNYKDLAWNWTSLSRNKTVTLDYVLQHPELPWDWESLSNNNSITLDDIIKHPELPWDYTGLSRNANLSIQYIYDNIDKPWDWEGISLHLFDYRSIHFEYPYIIRCCYNTQLIKKELLLKQSFFLCRF